MVGTINKMHLHHLYFYSSKQKSLQKGLFRKSEVKITFQMEDPAKKPMVWFPEKLCVTSSSLWLPNGGENSWNAKKKNPQKLTSDLRRIDHHIWPENQNVWKRQKQKLLPDCLVPILREAGEEIKKLNAGHRPNEHFHKAANVSRKTAATEVLRPARLEGRVHFIIVATERPALPRLSGMGQLK